MENPSLADFKFRIANRWQGGGLNRTTVKASYGAGTDFVDREGKFTMQADEPPILLSGDQAANPLEHLLHALAACVTTSMVYHAAARNIPLEAVESELDGELDLHGFLGLKPDKPHIHIDLPETPAHVGQAERGTETGGYGSWSAILPCLRYVDKRCARHRQADR